MSFDLRIKNADLSIINGKLEKVTGSDKLIQDILKIIYTDAGTNPFNPWYGSYFNKSIVGSNFDSEMIVKISQNQLQNTLDMLKKIQQLQVSSLQTVTPDEQIASIVDISVNRSKVEPRLFDVIIKVLTRALTPVNVNFSINI